MGLSENGVLQDTSKMVSFMGNINFHQQAEAAIEILEKPRFDPNFQGAHPLESSMRHTEA